MIWAQLAVFLWAMVVIGMFLCIAYPVLEKSIMKFFHIHDWGNYGEPFGVNNGYEKLQSRYCKTCNKCHVSKVKAPWNVWFGASAMLHQKTETK